MEEKKTVQENVVQGKKGLPKGVSFMLVLLFGLLIGGGGVFGYLSTTDSEGDVDKDSATLEVEDLAVLEASVESNLEVTQIIEEDLAEIKKVSPAYTLNIGKSSKIEVPEGWHVSNIVDKLKTLEKENIQFILKDDIQEFGYYPINRGTIIDITNGKSTMTYEVFSNFIAGPFGFNEESIPSNAVIVKKPVGDTHGYAREEKNGVYTYYSITLCQNVDMCGEYADASIGLGRIIVTFRGDLEDLKTADFIFEQSVVGTNFGTYD